MLASIRSTGLLRYIIQNQDTDVVMNNYDERKINTIIDRGHFNNNSKFEPTTSDQRAILSKEKINQTYYFMSFRRASYQLPIEITMNEICFFVVYKLINYDIDHDKKEISCMFGNRRNRPNHKYRSLSFLSDQNTLRIRGTNPEFIVDYNNWNDPRLNPCTTEEWHLLCVQFGSAGGLWVNGYHCVNLTEFFGLDYDEKIFLGADSGSWKGYPDDQIFFDGYIATLEIYKGHIQDDVKAVIMKDICDKFGIDYKPKGYKKPGF